MPGDCGLAHRRDRRHARTSRHAPCRALSRATAFLCGTGDSLSGGARGQGDLADWAQVRARPTRPTQRRPPHPRAATRAAKRSMPTLETDAFIHPQALSGRYPPPRRVRRGQEAAEAAGCCWLHARRGVMRNVLSRLAVGSVWKGRPACVPVCADFGLRSAWLPCCCCAPRCASCL